MFSVARLYANCILPEGADYTFWGRGVSQGHSDAIRRVPGVLDARQYTVPVQSALDAVRSGANPELTTREKHTRECFVVAEEGADLAAIEKAIVEMPNYFADYDTTSPSSRKKSSIAIIRAFRMAARSSVRAQRVRTKRTST